MAEYEVEGDGDFKLEGERKLSLGVLVSLNFMKLSRASYSSTNTAILLYDPLLLLSALSLLIPSIVSLSLSAFGPLISSEVDRCFLGIILTTTVSVTDTKSAGVRPARLCLLPLIEPFL